MKSGSGEEKGTCAESMVVVGRYRILAGCYGLIFGGANQW